MYVLIEELARTTIGMSFRKLARRDAEEIARSLRFIICSQKSNASIEKFIKEGNRVFLEIFIERVYISTMCILLDAETIPNLLSRKIAEKILLKVKSTKRNI